MVVDVVLLPTAAAFDIGSQAKACCVSQCSEVWSSGEGNRKPRRAVVRRGNCSGNFQRLCILYSHATLQTQELL